MFKDKVITFVNPAHDPRLNPVAEDPSTLSGIPPPPAEQAELPAEPEDSPGRIHWGDFDPITDSEWQKLDGIEAVKRLVDEHGAETVSRWVRFVASNRGVVLPVDE